MNRIRSGWQQYGCCGEQVGRLSIEVGLKCYRLLGDIRPISVWLSREHCMTAQSSRRDQTFDQSEPWSIYTTMYDQSQSTSGLFRETMVSHVECFLRHRYHRICKPNFVKQKIALVVLLQIMLGKRWKPQLHKAWRPETQQFYRCEGGILLSASIVVSVLIKQRKDREKDIALRP